MAEIIEKLTKLTMSDLRLWAGSKILNRGRDYCRWLLSQ